MVDGSIASRDVPEESHKDPKQTAGSGNRIQDVCPGGKGGKRFHNVESPAPRSRPSG